MNSPFLQQLRERTAACHTALEQNALSVQLLSDGVTTGDYRRYLASLYAFVAGFEEEVYPQLPHAIADINDRRRTQLLEQDLRSLGQDIQALERMPAGYFKSFYEDRYEALGGLYVLEGSTLGGQLIQRHLHKVMGEEAPLHTLYFQGHGAATGPMWKQFLSALIAAAQGHEESVIEGAIRTFRKLDALMQAA